MTPTLAPLAKALNLPRTRLFRSLGILAALLAFMLATLGAGGSVLQGLYTSWDLAKRHAIMVYLPPATPTSALTPLNTTLPQTEGIASIRQVPPAEVQAALAPVLPTSGTLPLPIVLEVILAPTADKPTIQTLLQTTFPLAELDDQAPMVATVAQSVRLLQIGALTMALGLAVVLGLFMALTIRAGLLAQHTTVALLIQLGATDGALARTLATQATLPVLRGTLVGATLAGMALALLSGIFALSLGFSVWVMLLMPIVLLPLLALSVGAWVATRLLHHA